jgi:hypothetical protein
MQIKNCLYCEKEFEDNRSKTKLYCCSSCKRKYLYKKLPNVEKKCLHCNKEFLSRNGGKEQLYCSGSCRKKYFMKHLISDRQKIKNKELDILRSHTNPLTKYKEIELSTKYRKKSFNITYEHFLEKFWNKPCNYCGDKINGGGIDRVDSSMGYEPDNCVPCCPNCNRMKMALSVSDFLSHIQKIINHTAMVKPHDSSKQA